MDLCSSPVAPTALTATAPEGGKGFKLIWKQPTSPEIQCNRVFRSANGGNYVQLVLINSATAYQDFQVVRKVTYTYAVTAISANGQESPASNAVSIRLK